MSNSSKETEKNVKTPQRAQIQSRDWFAIMWCWANWYNLLTWSKWDKCLNIYQKNCLCHIKTQRHIFNWYYQSCVTKLDVGVFALQLLLSPSLIKFCSIYTLAWETDSGYHCFRTSNIITNYCNTCLIFWYLTSLLLNVLLGFEQTTSPLLSYNWEVRFPKLTCCWKWIGCFMPCSMYTWIFNLGRVWAIGQSLERWQPTSKSNPIHPSRRHVCELWTCAV